MMDDIDFYSGIFSPDSFPQKYSEFLEKESSYDENSTLQQTQDTDIVWGSMPIYEGSVEHYAEI